MFEELIRKPKFIDRSVDSGVTQRLPNPGSNPSNSDAVLEADHNAVTVRKLNYAASDWDNPPWIYDGTTNIIFA